MRHLLIISDYNTPGAEVFSRVTDRINWTKITMHPTSVNRRPLKQEHVEVAAVFDYYKMPLHLFKLYIKILKGLVQLC